MSAEDNIDNYDIDAAAAVASASGAYAAGEAKSAPAGRSQPRAAAPPPGERVSVFGLGYIGCVTAACLARAGHEVVGVDVRAAKVAMLNEGMATVLEPGLGELVRAEVLAHRLRATCDVDEAVRSSRFSLVCVGSPSQANGSLDLSHVERVCAQIGAALRFVRERHVVVLRSTVLPGTLRGVVIPALERESGKRAGHDFDVCVNPEFLRTGQALGDFVTPPFIIVGADSLAVAKQVHALYRGVEAPLRVTSIGTAEMLKYACNTWRAVKVSFANEIGNLCRAFDIDSHELMGLFCEDVRLNLSASYLKPGFAFGGSCLPKDLRALVYRGRQLDVATPILQAALESNRLQVARAYDLITQSGHKRVGILGMAFKAGSDDLRESPSITLIEMLLGKGYQLNIYDGDVRASQVLGANREYVEREIPHLWSLVRPSVAEVLRASDVIVIANGASEFRAIGPRLEPRHVVIDLVRALQPPLPAHYHGICW